MLPVFPLGVKKDVDRRAAAYAPSAPSFDPARSSRRSSAPRPRSRPASRRASRRTSAARTSRSSSRERAATARRRPRCSSRAPRSTKASTRRTSRATAPSRAAARRTPTSTSAEDEVLSPASPHPHILVAFNAPSLAKFAPDVVPGGTIVYDSSVIARRRRRSPTGVQRRRRAVHGDRRRPRQGDGQERRRARRALQAATGIFPEETFLTAIRQALKDKCALIPLNEEAFAWGVKSVKSAATPAH